MPHPSSVSGDAAWDAVRLSASTIQTAGQLGRACIRQVASPATSGAENEVPFARTYAFGSPEGEATSARTPCAARSGLMRPSTVGPLEENEARTPNESTAAIARTLSPFASAGAPTLRPTAGLL